MFINKHFIGHLAAAALIVSSFSAFAEEIRDYYAEPGLNPFKETTQDLNESIDVFSGTLQHKYVDLTIPGNGGLDITISRIYTSQQDSHVSDYRSYTGMGWTMHMGRIVVPTDHRNKICSQQMWSISTRDNPSVEFSDGSRELLVLKDANIDETLITKTNWKADCQSVTQGMRVTSPSGTVYTMDVAEFSADQYSWYTSRIEDPDGNWINIVYGTASGGIKYIDTITSSDGRRVSFEYKDIATNAVRLWKVTANGQTVEYDYTPVVGGPLGAQHLTQVTRPDSLKWHYTYFPDLGLLAGGSHSLQSVTYPHGGQIAYTYQLVRFEPTNPFETTSILTKRTSGTDITPGNWTYNFTPSTGVGTNDSTQVETPNGTEVYSHHGYVTGGSRVWPTGLLVQKIVKDSVGNPVEAITNTWSSRVISVENYWHGRDRLDSGTAAPVLKKRKHCLEGRALATVYSSHDFYGNPRLIEEECNLVGCSDRVTTRTYLNDTLNWYIGLPKVDTVVGVGTTSRNYYGNGRLKSLDEYGVITNYEYTPEGDLAKETDARGYSRTFSNYVRGIAEQESSEVSATKSIVTSRIVNPTGTVAMVTDGRSIPRSFTYDGLNRLESIDFPINDDVTVSYGKGTKTLTRGNYEEHSTLNGFGSTIRQDRKDLLSGEIISTTTSYDALGRSVFHSYPNSALGVTTEFDVINRPTKVTKGDETFKQIEYGSFLDLSGNTYLGEEKHTDERLNVSYRLYNYYGSFDNNVGLSNLITDETVTSIQRGILGEVTEIVQGKLEAGIITNAVKRSYLYDSRRFLESATNPETGTTVFGRDAIGNKISTQVGASAITKFIYDGISRLTDIDYTYGTLDVVLGYDDNSNLDHSVKGEISWAYKYDDNDNLELEQLTIAGVENRTYELSYRYNGLDTVSQITYPNGIVVDYAPDALGRPTQAGPYALSALYHPNGVLNSVQYGNGISITNSLNPIQQLDGILAISLTEDVVDLAYNYDPVGNVRDIVDARQPTDSLTLGYDVNNRIESATGRWGTGSVSYSPHGDILTKRLGSTFLAYGYGASRRLEQLDNLSDPSLNNRTNFQYDAYGNLSDKSVVISDVGGNTTLKDYTYLFDDASNLLEVDDLDTVEIERKYQYDANNYRIIEEEAGNKRFSVYNKAGILTYESDDLSCEDSAYIYLASTLVAKDVRTCTGADLVVDALSATPSMLQVGDVLTFTVRTTNQGTQASPVGTYTRLVLSSDALIDGTDRKLSSVWVPALAAGAFSEKTRSVTLPVDVVAGSYYLGAIVDNGDRVAEADEGNNIRMGPQISVIDGPDLIVNALSATPTALQPGAVLTFTVRTENQGRQATTVGTYTRLVLSGDAVIDGTDLKLRSVWVPPLAAGEISEKTRIVTLPADVVAGSYYLGAIVDNGDQVAETDEGNNTRTGPQISVIDGPDLIVSALSATPTALLPGAELTFTVRTENQGTLASAVGTYTRLALSIDAVIDDTDLKLRSVWVPPLAVGEFSEKTRSVTLPADVVAGSYYLGAIVDNGDQVVETDEGNNTQVGPQLTVQ